MRVSGIRVPEIATELRLSRTAVYNRLSRVYRKAGLKGVEDLKDWAIQNGFDEPLPLERPEDLPRREPRRTKTRIRMRRFPPPVLR